MVYDIASSKHYHSQNSWKVHISICGRFRTPKVPIEDPGETFELVFMGNNNIFLLNSLF